MKNLTAMNVVSQLQQQYKTSVCSWQSVSTNVIKEPKLQWQTFHKLFSTRWKSWKRTIVRTTTWMLEPKILTDGRRVVWRVRKAMLGLKTSPRRKQEHLSGMALFKTSAIRVCLWTLNWTMTLVCMWTTCWRSVPMNWQRICCKNSEKTWQCVGAWWLTNLKSSLVVLCAGHRKMTRFGSRVIMWQNCAKTGFGELKGSNTLNFEKPDKNDTILNESGQRCHRQLLGRLLWLDRPDIKNAVCQLPTHVGTTTTRENTTSNAC